MANPTPEQLNYAYTNGFTNQSLTTGHSEDTTAQLFNRAQELANRNNSVVETILETCNAISG